MPSVRSGLGKRSKQLPRSWVFFNAFPLSGICWIPLRERLRNRRLPIPIGCRYQKSRSQCPGPADAAKILPVCRKPASALSRVTVSWTRRCLLSLAPDRSMSAPTYSKTPLLGCIDERKSYFHSSLQATQPISPDCCGLSGSNPCWPCVWCFVCWYDQRANSENWWALFEFWLKRQILFVGSIYLILKQLTLPQFSLISLMFSNLILFCPNWATKIPLILHEWRYGKRRLLSENKTKSHQFCIIILISVNIADPSGNKEKAQRPVFIEELVVFPAKTPIERLKVVRASDRSGFPGRAQLIVLTKDQVKSPAEA